MQDNGRWALSLTPGQPLAGNTWRSLVLVQASALVFASLVLVQGRGGRKIHAHRLTNSRSLGMSSEGSKWSGISSFAPTPQPINNNTTNNDMVELVEII